METFYQDLIQLCVEADRLAPRKFYTTLRQAFFLVLDDYTKEAGIAFSGPFARMDYLAKEYKVSKNMYWALKQFRAKVKNISEQSEEKLKNGRLCDVRLLTEFFSIISETSIPIRLLDLLPKEFIVETSHAGTILSDVVRVTVVSWDDRIIKATVADEFADEIDVCYNFSPKEIEDFHLAGDMTHIGNVLKVHAQLNLIRPKVRDHIYYPEFIIYEPDFLVDISTIADSFEEYGLTPYSYLLKRLKPKQNTQPILIGNLAGQFLDEMVYHTTPPSYKESVSRFFRQNAMSLATCKELDSQSFHREAIHQQQNMLYYTERQLDGYRIFDPEKTLLEPSFFCEMLGVQGRMDLLHDDKKLLIEQKSGKWGYPSGGHQEKHYVQMLFYLAWIRYNQHISTDEVNALLLYSKYPMEGKDFKQENGLIKESPAPKLLFNAIALRNYIVRLEMSLVEGGIRVLERLTSEELNVNHTTGPLWTRYQQPEIEALIGAVKKADPLAKEYFYRFFTFLEKEYHLSKTSFAQAWNLSMEEKVMEGSIYSDLQLVEAIQSEEQGEGIESVRFRINELSQDNLPNFRKGDIVVCYPYEQGTSVNMCKDIVFRATLTDLTKEYLTIKLRAPQRNKHVFDKNREVLWALEHDFLDSSFSGAIKDLYSLLLMNNPMRSDLLLNRRYPAFDETKRLIGDYGQFNDLVLGATQALDYYFVIGPPGTGKTSFALVNILKETLLRENTSVLLISYTNRAVEEICSKLIQQKIDFIRIGHEHSCTEAFDTSYLLKNKIADCPNTESIKAVLSSNRVYVGTTAAISSSSSLFEMKQFDLAIVDEASQILEPQVVGLLSAANGSAIRKFVFIGDHKQLPAVVQQSERESKVTSELLNKEMQLMDCRCSFFERMLALYRGDERLVYMLDHQGRMHPDVADYVNDNYYAGLLKFVPLSHQKQPCFYEQLQKEVMENRLEQLLVRYRLLCLHVPRVSDGTPDNVNKAEAELLAEIVYRTWQLHQRSGKTFDAEKTVGVIVPYRAQMAMVRRELEKYEVDFSKVAVDTVERYQGSERDVIVYGTTVSEHYQLSFLANNILKEEDRLIDRKLNVAITRAREQMIIVGDTQLLQGTPSYRDFIQYLRREVCCYENEK